LEQNLAMPCVSGRCPCAYRCHTWYDATSLQARKKTKCGC
jgi:hypothetical protein